MNIINNGEKIYNIMPVEANKQYKISFELEGKLQFRIYIQKDNSKVKKFVTKLMPGMSAKYSYTFLSQIDGVLYIEETDRPGYNDWVAINNLIVEEI